MTEMPIAIFIVRAAGSPTIAPELPEDRSVRTPEARDNLPKGTITIDADECFALADGNGGYQTAGLDGTYPGHESVLLPAFIIAGPGLPALIPGGGVILASQEEVDQVPFEFYALDANGCLFLWDDNWESFGTFAWMAVGHAGKASPAFPITAWR